MKITACYEN